MITLITGTPGAGKTLYALSEIVSKLAADRPLFVDGIPDLAIKHFEPSGQLEQGDEKEIVAGTKTRESYDDWLPVGAVLVVDECQRVWRPRGTASKVPAGVAAMEKHRHKGHDLILITQHPSLLDANVRRLVGRHIHVRRVFGWNRAMIYEWDSATEPSKTTLAIRRSWPYPKKAFALYKSAEAHTKRGNRVPIALWLAGVAVLALPVVGYYAINRTAMKWTGGDALLTDASAATEPATAQRGMGNSVQFASLIPERLLEALTPTDDQNPLSAPLYASVVPPVVAPTIVGCIASSRACSCYSQQQTPVWLPDEQCRDRAAGRYYDPYKQPGNESYDSRAYAQKAEPVKQNPEIL